MSALLPSGVDMKFKELSQEFRRELYKAIRLSAVLTALLFGFLIFQNHTATQEEVSRSPASLPTEEMPQ